MKKYNEALSDFMKDRAKWIHDLLNIAEELYYNEQDREDILKWDKTIARSIWKSMKQNVRKKNTCGIHHEVCAFCVLLKFEKLKRDACVQCSYGSRHGLCGSKSVKNDYTRILEIFDSYGESHRQVFNSRYYKQLIKKIERKNRLRWWTP